MYLAKRKGFWRYREALTVMEKTDTLGDWEISEVFLCQGLGRQVLGGKLTRGLTPRPRDRRRSDSGSEDHGCGAKAVNP